VHGNEGTVTPLSPNNGAAAGGLNSGKPAAGDSLEMLWGVRSMINGCKKKIPLR